MRYNNQPDYCWDTASVYWDDHIGSYGCVISGDIVMTAGGNVCCSCTSGLAGVRKRSAKVKDPKEDYKSPRAAQAKRANN